MTAAKPGPRLTIGLPVYNGEDYLAAAIDALLAQTYTDFELIVSDNASTDGSGKIAEAYAALDPRVRYVRHPANLGSAENHNFVIREAKGEFFKWASDDDLYAPDLLERCIDALDARPEIPLAHAWTAFINEAGEITHTQDYPLTTDVSSAPERFRSLLYTQGGDDIYGVIRTRVLNQIKLHGSYHNADRVFVAELALHGPFHQIPEALYFRRDHPGRTERASSLRHRCAILDAKRADPWRHPVARLLLEYIAAYVAAIYRAPISWPDRLRCLRDLGVWVAGHADPRRKRKLADSPDPAVQSRATKP